MYDLCLIYSIKVYRNRKKKDFNIEKDHTTHTHIHMHTYCISTMLRAPILSFEPSLIDNSPVDAIEPSFHCDVSMNVSLIPVILLLASVK